MIKWIDIGANLMDPVFKGVYRNKVKHVVRLYILSLIV